MTFTLGIPADGQSLGNSKPQVRGNFTSIFNSFAVNHVALNSLPAGFHKRVDLVEVATPNPPVGSNSLFSQVSAIPLGELYYVRGSAGPTWTPIQMTNGDPINASSGVSFLPGGILIQWGNITLTGAQTPVVFPVAFQGGTTPYNIQLTGSVSLPASVTLSVSNTTPPTNLGFNIRCSPTPSGPFPSVYYLAIGNRTTL